MSFPENGESSALLRIVFWNLKRKDDLTGIVCDLASATEADILVLNECVVPIRTTLQALQANVNQSYFIPRSKEDGRFHCLCRDPALDVSEVHHGLRTSVRRLNLGSNLALLGLVHGVDMRNHDTETRQSMAQSLADDIRFVQSKQANNRFILIGDFNMNPFDRSMNLAKGFNAMMTRACIARGRRTFQGEEYDFYYNPMWGLFGDRSDGPAGTVYDTSSQGPYGWNMLDQVLLSHSVADEFHDVRILTHAGQHRLIDAQGRPDRNKASDHLPIVVELERRE